VSKWIRVVALVIVLSSSALVVRAAYPSWPGPTYYPYIAVLNQYRDLRQFYVCTLTGSDHNTYNAKYHDDFNCQYVAPGAGMASDVTIFAGHPDTNFSHMIKQVWLIVPEQTTSVTWSCSGNWTVTGNTSYVSASAFTRGSKTNIALTNSGNSTTTESASVTSFNHTITYTSQHADWYLMEPYYLDGVTLMPNHALTTEWTFGSGNAISARSNCVVTNFTSAGYVACQNWVDTDYGGYCADYAALPTPTPAPIAWNPGGWTPGPSWGATPIAYATPSVPYELGVVHNPSASGCYTLIPGYTETYTVTLLWMSWPWTVDIPEFILCVEEYDIAIQALGINWAVWGVSMLAVAGAGIWYSRIKH
jgi:hypothetical protein